MSSLSARLLAAAGSLLLFVAPAFAGTITHSEAGVEITHPDDWEVAPDEDQVLVASDPEHSVRAIYRIADSKDDTISEAVKDAILTLKEDTADLEIKEEFTEFTQNGMTGVEADGTGTYEGKPVAIKLIVIQTPKDKILVATYDIYQKDIDALAPTVSKIWQSIKPVA